MNVMTKRKLNDDVVKHIRMLGAAVGTLQDVADITGISIRTVYRRLDDPERLTLAEIRELNALAQKEGLNYTFM